MLPELETRARAWLQNDPDPATKRELEAVLEANDGTGLTDRFAACLEFGTAGLRGKLGAGPNRMNRVNVIRATAALCAWAREKITDAQRRGICIGFDGRTMSREFAREAAAVCAGAGFRVRAFSDLTPTPLLAFSVLDLGAAAGIMITASHNPAEYNGLKVYWENGAQIIPPHDAGIAAHMGAINDVRLVPRSESGPLHSTITHETVDRYFAGLKNPTPRQSSISIAYTALHGVGENCAGRALIEAGFSNFRSVREQAAPDGAFPTVAFPNPEEKGAMDLVLALGREVHADVVIANDPDADRLGAAAPDAAGRFVMLTGNEIGCLLAHYVLENTPRTEKRLVVSSIVSSPMLGAIARAHGARWEQTLTGFKWITHRAMQLERTEGYAFVFGYEEALGYTMGTLVRDKDGISAALALCGLTDLCKAQGRTLLDERERMWRRYGMYLSDQVSRSSSGPSPMETMRAAMTALRGALPNAVGGRRVTACLDLLRGHGSFAPSDVVILELEGGHRLMVRPSGTEPKIKYYFDVCVEVGPEEPAATAHARGQQIMNELRGAFFATIDG